MVTRLSRSEQTGQNRARVLAAAREVFLRRGFHAVSVDEIAEAAGFSRGVVYSQFGGKADLLLALLEERISERAEQNRVLAADLAGIEGVRAIAAAGDADREDNAGWVMLLVEFRVHAARDPDLSARYAELHERTVTALADTLEGVYARAGIDPPRPARTLAQAMLAIGVGVTLERAADPDVFDSDGAASNDVFAPTFEPAR